MTKLYSVKMPDNKTYVAVGQKRSDVARKYGVSMTAVKLGATANLPPVSQYKPVLSLTRLKILLAIGACDTPPTLRELAQVVGLSFGGVNGYFCGTNPFVNGEYATWTPGKGRTLRLTERGQKAIQGYALRRFCGKPAKIYRNILDNG